MWQLVLVLRQEEDRELYEGIEDPENTLALKFRISTCLPTGKIASAVQRVVGRRYHENDRIVGVWRSFTEGEDLFKECIPMKQAGLSSDDCLTNSHW
ncbi:hypothetical protein P3T76_006172 [Phytophthora citrophthora]|uniref:Uncharacterized protein n=1 Tax=Phytophthora citrophthora TaxID=4793 RepID=A0AAD9GR15_9STRA|nr:hypothetical protein P3T76_006172 [Phytophthora citrophthora]